MNTFEKPSNPTATEPIMLSAPLVVRKPSAVRNADITTGTIAGKLESSGGDYAEWMRRVDPEEKILPGEVVGIHKGKISKKTDGAANIGVVSDRWCLIGNTPSDEDREYGNPVTFSVC